MPAPPETVTVETERVRVSVTERLAAAMSLALASLSGGVGALAIVLLFRAMRDDELFGTRQALAGFVRIELIVGGLLAAAVVLGLVAVGVSSVRMFAAKKTASPPGVRLFAGGILSLISPSLVWYALNMATDALLRPDELNISNTANAVNLLTYGSFIATGVSLLLLMIYAFIPMRSTPGRKYTPTAAAVLLTIAIITLAAMFFWLAKLSVESFAKSI